MKHIDFENAIKYFGCENFVLVGTPIDEQDFYKRFKLVTCIHYDKENEYEEDITKYPFTWLKLLEQVSIQEKIRINNEYQQQRSKEYPSVGDQLDALFKAGLFPEEMAEQIQAVKDKYPKL